MRVCACVGKGVSIQLLNFHTKNCKKNKQKVTKKSNRPVCATKLTDMWCAWKAKRNWVAIPTHAVHTSIGEWMRASNECTTTTKKEKEGRETRREDSAAGSAPCFRSLDTGERMRLILAACETIGVWVRFKCIQLTCLYTKISNRRRKREVIPTNNSSIDGNKEDMGEQHFNSHTRQVQQMCACEMQLWFANYYKVSMENN